MNKIILAGCVISDGGAILLLKRIKTGWYELPGGKVEPGEGIAETAAREVYEELRVNVDIRQELGSSEFILDDKEYEYHWFLAEIQPDQVLEIGKPQTHEKFDFLSFEALRNYKLSPNVQNLLQAINDGSVKLL